MMSNARAFWEHFAMQVGLSAGVGLAIYFLSGEWEIFTGITFGVANTMLLFRREISRGIY